jgi:hypothetical protein
MQASPGLALTSIGKTSSLSGVSAKLSASDVPIDDAVPSGEVPGAFGSPHKAFVSLWNGSRRRGGEVDEESWDEEEGFELHVVLGGKDTRDGSSFMDTYNQRDFIYTRKPSRLPESIPLSGFRLKDIICSLGY